MMKHKKKKKKKTIENHLQWNSWQLQARLLRSKPFPRQITRHLLRTLDGGSLGIGFALDIHCPPPTRNISHRPDKSVGFGGGGGGGGLGPFGPPPCWGLCWAGGCSR